MLIFCATTVQDSYIFIPMDESQNNHLKAYGIAYYAIERDVTVDWLLNYQGGSLERYTSFFLLGRTQTPHQHHTLCVL